MGSAQHGKAPLSILLVEDEKCTLELLASILANKYPAITFYTAEDGKDAMEIFRAHLPSIVITDLNMPEMDGVEMADEMRTLKADTKFIVLTGRSEQFRDLSSTGKGPGFDGIIGKPVDFGEFFSVLEGCF